MLRVFAMNFCTALSDSQSPSNFFVTLAIPALALLLAVTSDAARLSCFLPVHAPMCRSINTALVEIETCGALIAALN